MQLREICDNCFLPYDDQERFPKIVCSNGHDYCLKCLNDYNIKYKKLICFKCKEEIKKEPKDLITIRKIIEKNMEIIQKLREEGQRVSYSSIGSFTEEKSIEFLPIEEITNSNELIQSSKRRLKPKFKFILLGDSGVGKSSLIKRYFDDSFVPLENTIGFEFLKKTIKIDNKELSLTCIDTAGYERYAPLTKSFYKNATAVVFVFDLERIETLYRVEYWLKEYNENKGLIKEDIMMLIGNKIDLGEDKMKNDEIEKFANQHRMTYFAVSAKTGVNVKNAFEDLIRKFYSVYKKEIENICQKKGIVLPPDNNKKKHKSFFSKLCPKASGKCIIF